MAVRSLVRHVADVKLGPVVDIKQLLAREAVRRDLRVKLAKVLEDKS